MQTIATRLTLVGTTDMRLAVLIGKPISIAQITHGDKTAKIKQEGKGLTTVIVVDYKGELYEIQKTSQSHIQYA